MRRLFYIMMIGMALGAIFFISSVAVSQELVIVGTGSGMPLLKAVGKAFTEQNPGIVIVIPESIGSGGGIRAVGNDEYLIGRVARDIQEKEKPYGLKQISLAKIPIVFFINSSVSALRISAEQACGIYNGTIRGWDEINKGKGTIRVIKREDGDSSLIVLRETLPGFRDLILTSRSKTTYTDQENVKECQTEENTIAFGSWADVKNEEGVRALELDGMHPSNPDYPYTGFLFLVYKEKNYNGTVREFIEFISSDAAKKAIIQAGGLPVN